MITGEGLAIFLAVFTLFSGLLWVYVVLRLICKRLEMAAEWKNVTYRHEADYIDTYSEEPEDKAKNTALQPL